MAGYDYQKKYFCPRLLDYILIVGSRHPNRNDSVVQTPELLRRYPLDDHTDFPLPPDVVFFCQPEGCVSVGQKRLTLRDTTSFVFALTEKDSGRTRYGICVNFYRSFERSRTSRSDRLASVDTEVPVVTLQPPGEASTTSRSSRRQKSSKSCVRNNTLTSLCIVSHHPFFSSFRECLFVLRRLITACSERSSGRRMSCSKANPRESVWGVLSGQMSADSCPSAVMHDIRQLETWILRLLSAPVSVPGKTRVEVPLLPAELHHPLVFALPDHTRFSLVDFPLHLPLELLGVDTCLKVLSCIMLEHKIVLQSRDYNALSMSVMAFVAMLYPLEYMFPIIPLLPTCMSSAEQLLMVPTPFIIGIPSSFLMYKKGFMLPDDVWLVDLDSNQIRAANQSDEVPDLPEPEGSMLKNHLKQALASMSMSPQPITNLETVAPHQEWQRRDSFSSATTGFNPLIYGNDVDSVDVATRVAMIRFYNSPNILGNFTEHTRTLRLYPRPVVAFQLNSFMKSRLVKTKFAAKLAKTQAVEYFVEWALSPTNAVFLRVQTGVYDPSLVGDKSKWFSHLLAHKLFQVYDESSTLAAALDVQTSARPSADDNITDESGGESEGGADSTSSSYSSLSDLVTDIQNSEISGDTPERSAEDQVLTVDESSVYQPPSQLQLPTDDVHVSNSDSAVSGPDSDDNSSDNSDLLLSPGPRYADEESPQKPAAMTGQTDDQHVQPERKKASEPQHFLYDPVSIASRQLTSALATVTMTTPRSATEAEGGSSLRKPDVSSADKKAGTLPVSARRSNEALQSGTSSIGSLTGKVPPQRPPPPSPAALSKTLSLEKSQSGSASPVTQSSSPALKSTPIPEAESESSYTSDQQRSEPLPAKSPRTAAEAQDGDKNPLNIYAQAATSTISEWFGDSLKQKFDNLSDTVTDNVRGTGDQLKQKLDSISDTVSDNVRDRVILGGDSLKHKLDTISDTVSDNVRETGMKVKQTVDKMATVADSLSEGGSSKSNTTLSAKSARPFAPLGNRKALVEKSGLVKHAAGSTKAKDAQSRQALTAEQQQRNAAHSENQQFLKDVTTSVLEGRGVGFLKQGRVKKLMEDENYRNFVVSRLNTALEKKLTDENQHLEDVCVTKSMFRGMVTMVRALVAGLEHTYQSRGSGGMASTVMILEIMHTHYWEKEGSSKSDTSNQSLASTPFGSSESLASMVETKAESHSLQEEHMVAALGHSQGWQLEPPTVSRATAGGLYASSSSSVTSGSAGGAVKRDVDNNISADPPPLRAAPTTESGVQSTDAERQRDSSSGYTSESGDLLRELVEDKDRIEMPRRKPPVKMGSGDSEMSDTSNLTNTGKRRRTGSIFSTKSHLSTGYRYRDGHLLNIVGSPVQESSHTYLFECFIEKERSALWDQIQFWEDVFLDAVAQERDIIGMDQGPTEMMERYKSLGDAEKKRLEMDEDHLLAVMLYNQIAFMVMMRVNKNEVRRKARRLLGKCHIGLACSQELNQLLDQIGNLHGNDIDLKPLGSRLMQKQSFTVHWGADNTGDMLFMEVCDDCLILRSVTGAICERWWFEKLVNMTYCPKTKVLCLWRKHDSKTQLNKFYTKKCKELYTCVKDSMDKAASRNSSRVAGLKLESEFPVQDLKSGQGGLLQVCMEGIGLLFANTKFFIELCRIRKCFTQKGDVFVLEEYDPKTRKVIHRRYKSSMANEILFAFHRVLSVQLTMLPVHTDESLSDDDDVYNYVVPATLPCNSLEGAAVAVH